MLWRRNDAESRAVAAVCESLERRCLLSGASSKPSLATYSLQASVADVTGDGTQDILAINHLSSQQPDRSSLNLILANSDGTLQMPVNLSSVDSPNGVAVADFNGDGKPDLAVSSGVSGTVSVLLGNGNGTFAPPVDYYAGGTLAVTTGDFTGDGETDIITANGRHKLGLLQGSGRGGFAPVVIIPDHLHYNRP